MAIQNTLPFSKSSDPEYNNIMTTAKFLTLLKAFQVPLLVLLAIPLYLLLLQYHLPTVALVIAYGSILLGSYDLLSETVISLTKRQFALDYIAILAIVVSLITQQYVVAMVIALMTATGQKLEQYGAASAKASLTALIDRLPHEILVVEKNKEEQLLPLDRVNIGQTVLVRKGEVVGLDGTLLEKTATLDEASLTGEPYPVEKFQHDTIRSGTINVGNPFTISVTQTSQNSTYAKIIELVRSAQEEKAPLIRLADKYSTYFTVITFVIAAAAYIHTPTLISILAVLVVATPCPLILATPIALLGGVNAAAKKRIIIKKLASIESLEKVNTVVFDKTGTITLGKPVVTKFEIHTKIDTSRLLGIAAAIERNSLHPLAKAIVMYATEKKTPRLQADNITETVGKGISGTIDKTTYTLSKVPHHTEEMLIGLYEKGELLATFTFTDEIKTTSKSIINQLQHMGLSLFILTGDKKLVTDKLVTQLGISATVKAELSPQQKQEEVSALKKKGNTVAMVGDGINDAPALALADVGMVFSNQEQTAATDAADIVIMGGNFSLVLDTVLGAKKTIRIAKESILWGIGMSIAAMIFAAWGFIPPLYGAILQEAIDVVVIINALRAAR